MQTSEMISVNDLAKELSLTSRASYVSVKDVLVYLPTVFAFSGRPSHGTLLEQHTADLVRQHFENLPEVPAPVHVDKWLDSLEEPADNKAYLMPQQQMEPYPLGFFYAMTHDGRSAGFGWSCYDCHMAIPFGAPHEVRHCGRVDVLDTRLQLLTHVLRSGKTYSETKGRSIVAGFERRLVRNLAAAEKAAALKTRIKEENEKEAARVAVKAAKAKARRAAGKSRVHIWFRGLWD